MNKKQNRLKALIIILLIISTWGGGTSLSENGKDAAPMKEKETEETEMAYAPVINIGGVDYPFMDEEARGLISNNSITDNGVCGYEGTFLTDANEAEKNSIYRIYDIAAGYPANLPSQTLHGSLLITITSQIRYNDNGQKALWVQLITDDFLNVMYRRTRSTGFSSDTWSNWEKIAYNPKKNSGKFGVFFDFSPEANNLLDYGQIVAWKYTDRSDGSVENNANFGYIVFPVTAGTVYVVDNINDYAILCFYNSSNIGSESFIANEGYRIAKTTEITAPTGATYAALSVNMQSTVNAWAGLKINHIERKIKNEIKPQENVLHETGIVGYSGTALSDANDAEANSLYKTYDSESQYFMDNVPKNVNGYLLTVRTKTSIGTMVFWNQIIFDENFVVLYRRRKITGYGSEEWGDWIANKATVYVRKNGGGDFTKITDALAYGMQNKNTTIYVDDGEYDIITELGNDYFENFTYVAYANMGPFIGNGTHLICSPKSKIVCNYTGNNSQVDMGFSIFNATYQNNPAGIGDFIIEGANVEASRIRYIVHDDVAVQTIPYKHQYINCNMKIDNSQNIHHTTHYSIGGGMGINGAIIVRGSIFDGEGTDDVDVYWHNSNNSDYDALGFVEISDCYFRKTGTIRIQSVGNYNTKKTPCMIHGNSLGAAIVYQADQSTTPHTDNMEVIEWNNEIRSN